MLSKWTRVLSGAAAVGLLLGAWAGAAAAADVTYDLKAGSIPLTMPDLATVDAFGLVDITGLSLGAALAAVPTVPGPVLEAVEGDNLTVNIFNTLATGAPTSFVLHGQLGAMVPVMEAGRVRSFTHETGSLGFVGYTYTNLKAGTYLYESGTVSQVQVPLGLYGVLIVRPAGFSPAAPTAYADPDTAYDREQVLVFSEVDPDLNAAVAGGTYGTVAFPSTVDFAEKYFLINGKAHPDTDTIVAAAGERLLLRLANAGSEVKVPTVLGLTLTVIAEDGNPLTAPYQTYGPTLPPGKTLDAIATLGGGVYPLFDQRLYLSNNGVAPGGMLTLISAPGATAAGVTLAAAPTSPTFPFQAVAFTGQGQGGSGFYEYRFLRRAPGSTVFAEVQPFSADDTWTWTPTGADLGTSRVVVQVRTAGSAGNSEAQAGLNHRVNAPPAATGVTLAVAPPSPSTAPVTVVFTAAGQGGSGVYEYRFLRRAPGGTIFVEEQAYSLANTWVWNATAADAGTSRVVVQVRSAGSARVSEAQNAVNYRINP